MNSQITNRSHQKRDPVQSLSHSKFTFFHSLPNITNTNLQASDKTKHKLSVKDIGIRKRQQYRSRLRNQQLNAIKQKIRKQNGWIIDQPQTIQNDLKIEQHQQKQKRGIKISANDIQIIPVRSVSQQKSRPFPQYFNSQKDCSVLAQSSVLRIGVQKQQNKVWIGLVMGVKQNYAEQYPTRQGVFMNIEQAKIIQKIFRKLADLTLTHTQKAYYLFKQSKVMIIRDWYKQQEWYGLRQYYYYGGEVQCTRYGFNLIPILMNAGVQLIMKAIK